MKVTRIRFNGNDETEFDTVDKNELAILWYDFCKENKYIITADEGHFRTVKTVEGNFTNMTNSLIKACWFGPQDDKILAEPWLDMCVNKKYIELEEVDIEDEDVGPDVMKKSALNEENAKWHKRQTDLFNMRWKLRERRSGGLY